MNLFKMVEVNYTVSVGAGKSAKKKTVKNKETRSITLTPGTVGTAFCRLLSDVNNAVDILRTSNTTKERVKVVTEEGEKPLSPDYVIGLINLSYTFPSDSVGNDDVRNLLHAVELYGKHCKRIDAYLRVETAKEQYTVALAECSEFDAEFNASNITE